MAITNTVNKDLNIVGIGDTGWGPPTNDNVTILDKAFGSFTTVSGTSGSITLTDTQYQNMCLKSDTAAFFANVTFVIPSGVAGQWVVINQSAASNFELRIKNAANATFISIPIGQVRSVYSDGTSVFLTNTQSIADFETLQIGTGFTTTAASCSGTNATVTFSGSYVIDVGQVISIKGMVPDGYNGIWTVTASSAGSVTFVVPATLGVQTNAGDLYYGAILASTLNLSGRGYLAGRATTAEAEAGTDNQVIMTPLQTSNAFDSFLTTARVLAETAGGTLSGVGTYAYLGDTSGNLTRGNTRAGSTLFYAVIFDANGIDYMAMDLAGVPTGTWRLMSASWGSGSVADRWTGLFLRIS
jgi:hypothetical protein